MSSGKRGRQSGDRAARARCRGPADLPGQFNRDRSDARVPVDHGGHAQDRLGEASSGDKRRYALHCFPAPTRARRQRPGAAVSATTADDRRLCRLDDRSQRHDHLARWEIGPRARGEVGPAARGGRTARLEPAAGGDGPVVPRPIADPIADRCLPGHRRVSRRRRHDPRLVRRGSGVRMHQHHVRHPSRCRPGRFDRRRPHAAHRRRHGVRRLSGPIEGDH